MVNPTNRTISTDTLWNAQNELNVSQDSTIEIKPETAARIRAMSDAERRAWAETVTMRIRDGIIQTADAFYTLEERKRLLLDAVQEALSGEAWRIKGHASWAEYWKAEFSDAKIYATKDERDEIIRHLKQNGYTQSLIAPIVGLSQRGVSKVLQREEAKGVQLRTEFYAGHLSDRDIPDGGKAVPGTPVDGGAPRDAPDDEVIDADVVDDEVVDADFADPDEGTDAETLFGGREFREPEKYTGTDGKQYSAPRSREGRIRDWLWFKGLMEPVDPGVEPVSTRTIESMYGVPRSTVSSIMNTGRPSDDEYARLWIRAKRIQASGNGLARVAKDLGIRLEGVKWMMDPANAPDLLTLLDRSSILQWGSAYGQRLRLIDGTEITQMELAAMIGKSQPAISQRLKDVLDQQDIAGAKARQDAEAGYRDYDHPELGSAAEASDRAAAGLELDYHRRGLIENGTTADPGPAQWVAAREREADGLDVRNPASAPWFAAFARCSTDLLDHLVHPLNIMLNDPSVLGVDELARVSDVLGMYAGLWTRWKDACDRVLEDRANAAAAETDGTGE